MFDALATGATAVAEARARAAGCDLSRRHVLLHVQPSDAGEEPAWPVLAERVETRLHRIAAGAVSDTGRQTLRAVLPLDGNGDELEELRAELSELGAAEAVHVGVSEPRRGAQDGGKGLREAADAARVAGALAPAGGAFAYADLGAYRYLVHLPLSELQHDRHFAVVQQLLDYDRRRRASLVETLEEYLHNRGSAATTARNLYVHPNTLRQRLDRIQKITGLDLDGEDLLSLELAIKLVRLRGD
jgi:sugar diacid utilization regulator